MKTPEQYLKEIKQLANKINGWYSIPEQDRDMVTTDAFLAFYKHIQSGSVQCEPYQAYKGYMFITMKSFICRYFNKQKTLMNRNTQFLDDTSGAYDLQLVDNLEATNASDILSAIGTLDDDDKNIINLKIQGYSHKEIKEIFNSNSSNFTQYRLDNIKKHIQAVLAIQIQKPTPKPPKKYKPTLEPPKPLKRTYRVTDITTGKVVIYATQVSFAKFLGITRQAVGIAIKTNSLLFQKKYKLEIA